MVMIVLIVRHTIVKKAVIVLTVHASIVREVIVRLIIVRNVLIIIIEKKALGEEETLILADLGRVIVLLTGNRLMEVMTVNVAPEFLQEVLHTDVRKEE
jgi:hypothetical protein